MVDKGISALIRSISSSAAFTPHWYLLRAGARLAKVLATNMVSLLRLVGVSVIGLGPALAYYCGTTKTIWQNSSLNQKLKTIRVTPDSHSTIALGSLAALIALVKTPLGGLPPPPDTTTSAKEDNPDECAATGQQGKKAKRRKRTPFYKKGPIV